MQTSPSADASHEHELEHHKAWLVFRDRILSSNAGALARERAEQLAGSSAPQHKQPTKP